MFVWMLMYRWQLPNRGRAMTIIAMLVDLILGGMLAWVCSIDSIHTANEYTLCYC
jgi:hypothetical protein